MSKLNAKQQRFAEQYLIDLNASQAAIRAGYSPKTANEQGSRLLTNVKVQELIQAEREKLSVATGISQKAVLDRLWAIAMANPNEIVKHRRVNCRYCWGVGHKQQWTAGEYEAAQKSSEAMNTASPDIAGGLGFDRTRPPHPDCPECHGEGLGQVFIEDTSKLSGPAAVLYAGAKEGKFGIEIMMHDQVAALVKIGMHLGLFSTKVDVTGDIKTTNLNVNISADEAERRIIELQKKIGIAHG